MLYKDSGLAACSISTAAEFAALNRTAFAFEELFFDIEGLQSQFQSVTCTIFSQLSIFSLTLPIQPNDSTMQRRCHAAIRDTSNSSSRIWTISSFKLLKCSIKKKECVLQCKLMCSFRSMYELYQNLSNSAASHRTIFVCWVNHSAHEVTCSVSSWSSAASRLAAGVLPKEVFSPIVTYIRRPGTRGHHRNHRC